MSFSELIHTQWLAGKAVKDCDTLEAVKDGSKVMLILPEDKEAEKRVQVIHEKVPLKFCWWCVLRSI